jgi:hypothetical protein
MIPLDKHKLEVEQRVIKKLLWLCG